MWNRTLISACASVAVLFALAVHTPTARGQVAAELQTQLAGCQSAAALRLPDVDWSQATVNVAGYDPNGNTVILWSFPGRSLSGTCVSGADGTVAQFNVSARPTLQNNSGLPAFESQVSACRAKATSSLPGLTWGQLNVESTAYPQTDGTYSLRWSGPGGVPSGTCIINSQGIVTEFYVN